MKKSSTSAKTTAAVDLFAGIAAQQQQSTQHLTEPQPLCAEPKILPSVRSNPDAAFKPVVKKDTATKLNRQVTSLRNKMYKFLQDYSPPLLRPGICMQLDKMHYRLMEPGASLDESAVATEYASWPIVTIPHYGPPLGRATAYYATSFTLEEAQLTERRCWVHFGGVDYKAHIFVNGTYVGSHEGFFAEFEFDVSRAAHAGKNLLVIRVENDAICMGNDSWGQDGMLYEGDKLYAATGPGYDDPEIGWHHCPPAMGIYAPVSIETRSPIHIADIFVRPNLAEQTAELWIELESAHTTRVDAVLEFTVCGRNFRKRATFPNRSTVHIGPGRNYYRFSAAIPNPRIWDMDAPWLYQTQVKLYDTTDRLLDCSSQHFGMRSFTLDTSGVPRGMFYLNNRPIRLRGANDMGYIQQCVMHNNDEALYNAILLAKVANMNFLRITQRPVHKQVYDACDKLGLLTQTDLPLFGVMRRNQFCEGVRQAEEMERIVRSHPCNIMVTYINEPFRNAWGKPHRHLTDDELHAFFRACDQAVLLANPDRVIKPVDGDYCPPHEGLPDNHCYNTWYNNHGLPLGKLINGYWQPVIKRDWNYACGEFGAEGLDPVETMYKYYPKDWLPESPDDTWNPASILKAQTGNFHYMWFPTQRTLSDWVYESQQFQAWAVRTQTEAFRRDPRMISFAIHLFIDAFPSGWMKAIMDCDANPKPAYFAYKDALSPLMVSLRTDRRHYYPDEKLAVDVWLCNDHAHQYRGITLHYQVRTGRNILFSQKMPVSVGVCTAEYKGTIAWKLPNADCRTPLVIEAALVDAKGKRIHDTSHHIEVIPSVHIPKNNGRIFVIGDKKGPARQMLKHIGLSAATWTTSAPDDTVILADNLADVLRHKHTLEAAIAKGTTLVLSEPTVSDDLLGKPVTLADCTFTIEQAGFGSRYFVNCNTGHPAVASCGPHDFFLWYNQNNKRIDAILPHIIHSSDLTAILLTGQGVWGQTQWSRALAAGSACFGRGGIVVSLVCLADYVTCNPTARQYAHNLLTVPPAHTDG